MAVGLGLPTNGNWEPEHDQPPRERKESLEGKRINSAGEEQAPSLANSKLIPVSTPLLVVNPLPGKIWETPEILVQQNDAILKELEMEMSERNKN